MGRLLATLVVAILVVGIFIAFGGNDRPAAARLAAMQAVAPDPAIALRRDAEGGRLAPAEHIAACVAPCLPDRIEMGPILANGRPQG